MQSSSIINTLGKGYSINGQYGFSVSALFVRLSLVSSLPSDKNSVLENFKISSYISKEKSTDRFLVLKNNYEIEDKSKIKDFIISHNLIDFLLWINQPIIDIFGDITKTLHLFRCWDEEDYHLVLNIFSELDDMDDLSEKESKLFDYISGNKKDNFLNYVVIAQR